MHFRCSQGKDQADILLRRCLIFLSMSCFMADDHAGFHSLIVEGLELLGILLQIKEQVTLSVQPSGA
jgi:hypothetical protein